MNRATASLIRKLHAAFPRTFTERELRAAWNQLHGRARCTARVHLRKTIALVSDPKHPSPIAIEALKRLAVVLQPPTGQPRVARAHAAREEIRARKARGRWNRSERAAAEALGEP